ncbi:MAG: cysteine dioxygenase family protein, partial [Achromobacter sp.]|nr:cysteine dioxygenase family protein [Achromobacter sp.]
MTSVQLATADLRSLCESVQAAQMNAARALLRELASSVANAGDMLRALPEDLRAGRADTYTRHIAYADPHGAFTVAYLIWRPGQFSPVHGHKTWCTYQVLQGELAETHYRWDPVAAAAIACGEVSRRPGDVVTAAPGLR